MGKYGVIRGSEATSAKTLLLFDQGRVPQDKEQAMKVRAFCFSECVGTI